MIGGGNQESTHPPVGLFNSAWYTEHRIEQLEKRVKRKHSEMKTRGVDIPTRAGYVEYQEITNDVSKQEALDELREEGEVSDREYHLYRRRVLANPLSDGGST